MGAVIEVKYFNSFVLKKTTSSLEPIWNGSLGVPEALGGYKVVSDVLEPQNWAIEEARIRGGYNNTSVDFGAKAYLVEEDESASFRINSLIYSGIFNSRTGINNSNVFSVAEDITKSADPSNGSIQKLYAEDSNLVVFQESKVSRALIDKDAIYSAEGGGSITSSNLVIGVIQPYTGEWGISKNPESFAVYGYQKYFSDKNNNVILRLSRDGITEVSNYGMIDFFRDTLNSIDNNNFDGYVMGGYDVHNSQYVVSTQENPVAFPSSTLFNTLSFDERAKGWVSFFTYKPEQIFSLRNIFYSAKSTNFNLSGTNVTATNISKLFSVSQVTENIPVGSIVTGVGITSTGHGTRVVSYTPTSPTTGDVVINRIATLAAGVVLSFSGSKSGLWEHYSSSVDRGNFYGVTSASSISFVVNPQASNSKSFQAINYEGSSGWQMNSFVSDRTGQMFLGEWTNSSSLATFDTTSGVKSYFEGEYVVSDLNVLTTAAQPSATTLIISPTQGNMSVFLIPVGGLVTGVGVPNNTRVVSFDSTTNILTVSQNVVVPAYSTLNISMSVPRSDYFSVYGTNTPSLDRYQSGFDLKENKYVANLINESIASEREVSFGQNISGIKGFYADVTFTTDETTDPGNEKQLFSVGTTYIFNNGY
tara:strand:+ start:96 stop:2033 length:1938 start_codon:yes stop_codon:yes gene_type:complete